MACISAFRRLFLIMLALLLIVAGCGDAPEPAAPVPTNAPAPTEELAPAEEPADESDQVEEATPRSDEVAPQQGPAGDVETSGNYLADSGFRPDVHGFSFENYGGDSGREGLTPSEMQRMFGDIVCAAVQGDTCLLTPAAEQWMQEQNQSMDGGHCEGFAALSHLMYGGEIQPQEFGGNQAAELAIDGNQVLQHEIAYWFVTQATSPASDAMIKGTPNDILDILIQDLPGGERYVLGIYQRDGSGGHAITPFAVEDRGNGIFWILVYDNNYPTLTRAVEVDRNANTWRYSGSTNPAVPEDEYEGDADSQSLDLAPISPRLQQQFCTFCDEPVGSSSGNILAAPVAQYNEIYLDGDGDLLIVDGEGRRQGFVNGEFVNEIPGALARSRKFGVAVWDLNYEPVYRVPVGVDFTITLDGSRLEQPGEAVITMIGPGYYLEVSEISLEPGQQEQLDVSPDGSFLSYRSSKDESPWIYMGIETPEADYDFLVKGDQLVPGEAINLTLDTTEGSLAIDTIDNREVSNLSIYVARYDEQGEQVFGGEGFELNPDDVVYVDYLKWEGNGSVMNFDIDEGGDGTVDAVFEVPDASDVFEDE